MKNEQSATKAIYKNNFATPTGTEPRNDTFTLSLFFFFRASFAAFSPRLKSSRLTADAALLGETVCEAAAGSSALGGGFCFGGFGFTASKSTFVGVGTDGVGADFGFCGISARFTVSEAVFCGAFCAVFCGIGARVYGLTSASASTTGLLSAGLVGLTGSAGFADAEVTGLETGGFAEVCFAGSAEKENEACGGTEVFAVRSLWNTLITSSISSASLSLFTFGV